MSGPLRIFATALPTGWCKRRLQRKAALAPNLTSFGWLLPEMGAAMGALSFRPITDKSAPVEHPAELRDLPALVADINTFEERKGEMAAAEIQFPWAGLNLNGKSPKATLWDNGLWVVKIPRQEEMRSEALLVEHVLMKLASRAGLHVEQTRIHKAGDTTVLLTRRFDESAAGGRHYCVPLFYWLHDAPDPLGYRELMDVIEEQSCEPGIDGYRLFQLAVWNGMTGNTHDFADRFWFRREANGWRLAPAVGLTCTFEKADHGLYYLEDSHPPGEREDWLMIGEYLGIDRPTADECLQHIEAALQDVAAEAWAVGVPDATILKLVKHLRVRSPWLVLESGLDEKTGR